MLNNVNMFTRRRNYYRLLLLLHICAKKHQKGGVALVRLNSSACVFLYNQPVRVCCKLAREYVVHVSYFKKLVEIILFVLITI